jgi:hypothetical protein
MPRSRNIIFTTPSDSPGELSPAVWPTWLILYDDPFGERKNHFFLQVPSQAKGQNEIDGVLLKVLPKVKLFVSAVNFCFYCSVESREVGYSYSVFDVFPLFFCHDLFCVLTRDCRLVTPI